MGGIFLAANIWKLCIVFLCGYLINKWIPINHPFILTDFLIRFIVKPLEFFAGSIAFFIGLVVNARYIRETILKKKHLQEQKRRGWEVLAALSGLLLIFSVHFYIGPELTLLFFSLSFLYGMISVER